ncbi:unnamed protein product [Polarella glacialis]|uniref:Uncharacterized protein n=1 Tax=Polarella glacialis TaxID=89957 RepID=A0A813G6H5_POLGL|nr:unnamed protein product [Polarella glacialis]
MAKRKGQQKGVVVRTPATNSVAPATAVAKSGGKSAKSGKKKQKRNSSDKAVSEKTEDKQTPAPEIDADVPDSAKREQAAVEPKDVAGLPAKSQKVAPKDSSDEGGDDSDEEESEEVDATEYIRTLQDFLKKNGKTHIGIIGRKLSKPDGLKLGKFFVRHADLFKQSNGQISLKP